MVIQEDTRQKTGKHNIKHEHFEKLGVELLRCKLPFGDYAAPPAVSIDTKENMDEIASNICGSAHRRFIDECKLAKAAGCQLIILVENEVGIRDISEVHEWVNPRVIYSDKCVQGPRLQKAMETISERYGTRFMFCRPEESAEKIREIIENGGRLPESGN
jgi:ribosome-associated protein